MRLLRGDILAENLIKDECHERFLLIPVFNWPILFLDQCVLINVNYLWHNEFKQEGRMTYFF